MPTRAEKVAADIPLHNDRPPTAEQIELQARARFDELVAFVKRDLPETRTFLDFECELHRFLFDLGSWLVALFLQRRHEELEVPTSEVLDGRRYARSQVQDREIVTTFGPVRFWRAYMRGEGGGYYPLDRRLKLPAEGFSLLLLSLVVRIATKVSYAQARLVVQCFLGRAPSVTSVERAVLGLGRNTTAWFDHAPAPEDDGDVLVIMIDSKATPTATAHELKKRRGKRRRRTSRSKRHRGRDRRRGWQEKRRRKKGDHTKNGRVATLVVMYTLKSRKVAGRHRLEGPINRRVYASYAPKRHAFAVARRDANRRGFGPDSGKRVQVVMDGETNFARYAKEFFPKAILTLDVIHALEYVWKAGRSFYREGSKQLTAWVAEQRERLYRGQGASVVRDLRRALKEIPKTGPGNKGKRSRLATAIGYLADRLPHMNYRELLDQDLEISSGPVEGAVRYVIGQRFDAAGMRWITERSEALLQLRCVEINGHWDDFMRFVESRAGPSFAALASSPAPLPTFGLTARQLIRGAA